MAQARRGRPRRQASAGVFVKVAQTGGEVKEVLLNGDKTVADALEAAGISHDSDNRIRVGGVEAELSDTLQDGDIVTLSGKVEGGE